MVVSVVELQGDEGEDLRPNHAGGERETAKVERMPEVNSAAEVHDDFNKDAGGKGQDGCNDAFDARPVKVLSSHDLVEYVDGHLTTDE